MSNHLFVGIDVSTSPGNVATFLDSDGQRVNKDLSFANNQPGAESFVSTLLNIAESSNGSSTRRLKHFHCNYFIINELY
jgi:hypothetical protein